MNEVQIFKSITMLSSYIYVKEKYERDLSSEQNTEDLESIQKLMLKLDKYSHVADREDTIEDSYADILSRAENGKISEGSLATTIKELIVEADYEEKNYILNSVIFVANEDGNLSDIEMGLIKQVAIMLGLNKDTAKFIENYKNSEFKTTVTISNEVAIDTKKNKSSKIGFNLDVAKFILLLVVIAGGIYLYISTKKPVATTTMAITQKEFQKIDKLFTSFAYVPYIDYKKGYKNTDILEFDASKKVILGACYRQYDIAVGYNNASDLFEKYKNQVCENTSFKLPSPIVLTINPTSSETLGTYSSKECETRNGEYDVLRQLEKDGNWKILTKKSKTILKSFIQISCPIKEKK